MRNFDNFDNPWTKFSERKTRIAKINKRKYMVLRLLFIKPPLPTARAAYCFDTVHLFVCLFVCLSICRQNAKKRYFLKN